MLYVSLGSKAASVTRLDAVLSCLNFMSHHVEHQGLQPIVFYHRHLFFHVRPSQGPHPYPLIDVNTVSWHEDVADVADVAGICDCRCFSHKLSLLPVYLRLRQLQFNL